MRQDLLRRTLRDEQACSSMFQQHRHATALEIKRYFVELLPTAILGKQLKVVLTNAAAADRLVQRNLLSGIRYRLPKTP